MLKALFKVDHTSPAHGTIVLQFMQLFMKRAVCYSVQPKASADSDRGGRTGHLPTLFSSLATSTIAAHASGHKKCTSPTKTMPFLTKLAG